MDGRYGDDGASPAPATMSHGELHRYMERGRDLRTAALAEALARGGRLVQKRSPGRSAAGGRPAAGAGGARVRATPDAAARARERGER